MNSLEILLDFTWIARRKRHWWRYCQSRPRGWKVWGCRPASPPPWVLPGGWGWWLPTLGPLRLSGSSLLLCWCWRRSRRIYFSPIWTQNTSKRKTVVDAPTCRQWQDSVLTGEGRQDKLWKRSTSQSEANKPLSGQDWMSLYRCIRPSHRMSYTNKLYKLFVL